MVLNCYLCCAKFIDPRGLVPPSLFLFSVQILGLHMELKIPKGSLYFNFFLYPLVRADFPIVLGQPLRGPPGQFYFLDFSYRIWSLRVTSVGVRGNVSFTGVICKMCVLGEQLLDFAYGLKHNFGGIAIFFLFFAHIILPLFYNSPVFLLILCI